MTATTAPRIYVACLAAYNAGRLHGAWIDATDADDIHEEVKAMLARSPVWGAEEWAIHDHEGFGPWSPSEYESFEHIAAAAKLIEEHGEPAAAWIANDDSVLDSVIDLDESFLEAYSGTFDSEREFAEALVDDIGLPNVGPMRIPMGPFGDEPGEPLHEALSAYLDWDAITRAFMEDCWSANVTDGVAIFRSY